MELSDLNNPKYKKLGKIIESRTGLKTNFKDLTMEKALRISNDISESINEVRLSSSYHKISKNKTFLEMLLLKEAIDDWIITNKNSKKQKVSEGRKQLKEDDISKSEAILAAKDLVDSIQKMLQDCGKLQNEQMPALVDAIRSQFDNDKADNFQKSANDLLTNLMGTLQKTRNDVDVTVRSLTDDTISPDVQSKFDKDVDRDLELDDERSERGEDDFDDESDSDDISDLHSADGDEKESRKEHKKTLDDDDFALAGQSGDNEMGRGERERQTESIDYSSTLFVPVVLRAIKLFINDGHSEVSTNAFLNKVMRSSGKPFMLKDLIKINRESDKIKNLVSSIDVNKIKFKLDHLSANNEPPAKEKNKEKIVSKMAERRRSRGI